MITELLGALGGWDITLSGETPDEIRSRLGYFGHVVIVQGPVDVAAHGDELLPRARYVGVLRRRQSARTVLSGAGLVYWLGDEDDKGHYLATKVTITSKTLEQAVPMVLPPTVTLGTIHPDASGTYSGVHQFESPRSALRTICDAFGREFRVNPDFTVDVGTAAQLYNTENPDTIVKRHGAGVDLDLVALGGEYEDDGSVIDYSTDVLLLGQTQEDGTFVTGSASAASVPYFDPQGNPVKIVRPISESGQTEGSVGSRSQLHLNRYNREARALKVTAEEYETAGNFVVGDNCWAYDPDTGIVDPANEVIFRGQVLHPDLIRAVGITWPLTEGHTVAFRTDTGEWLDLTPYVVWETGTNELTLGDLPKSLTGAGGNPIQDRADSLPDTVAPGAPFGLGLSSYSAPDPYGTEQGYIAASWSAPVQNVDGSVITDLDHYVVAWKWSDRATWQTTVTVDTEVDLPATLDLDHDVQVAAVDKTGNYSDWTPLEQVHVAADSTAPLAPADPAVTSYLGQLRIAWDGSMADGSAPPPDFNRVDVHVSTTTGFVPSDGTLVASLATPGVAYATAPYGATRWVRLVAYDNSHNASPASTSVSGATVQVADGDIAAMSVGKLTAGIMTADVTISGRFGTALTGARTELNALGLQKWDASGNLLVSITGTDALLTGTYRSATTGRRIEMGAAGALGEINFYAPDGSRSFLRAWTESGGVEGVQLGLEMSGTNSLWNRINYNSDEWSSYRARGHDFYILEPDSGGFFYVRQANTNIRTTVSSTDEVTRLQLDSSLVYRDDVGQVRQQIDDGGWTYWDAVGNSRFIIDGTALWMDGPGGSSTSFDYAQSIFSWWYGTGKGSFALRGPDPAWGSSASSILRMSTGNGHATNLKLWWDSVNGVWLELKDWTDVNWIGMRAATFTAMSDRATKDDISDFTGSALARIRGARVRRYRRKRGRPTRVGRDEHGRPVATDEVDTSAPVAPGPEEIGLVAQEAPAEIVHPTGDGTLGIDLYQMASLLWAGLQELDKRIDDLQGAA